MLIIIIGQGIFGYLTVSLKLHPLIVTSHLFGAIITTSLFLIIFMRSLKLTKTFDVLARNKTLIIIGFALIIFQIFLGAWTSTNYAARACLDLPYCQGQLVPETNFKEGFNLFQSIGPNYLYGQMSNEQIGMPKSAPFGSRIRPWVDLDLQNSKKIINIYENSKIMSE